MFALYPLLRIRIHQIDWNWIPADRLADYARRYVHRADQTERYRFIEDVASNRGVNLRTFTDEADALGWLLDG